MDRFEAMALLREVVDRGSLSAAGRSLRIPVPTLSRKISDLEARLGARLLLRTTRRLTLTDAGATYLAAARRILDEVDEAEREAAGEFTDPKGDLVVTAPLQFGRLHVLPVVVEFLAQFPAINVRLALADRNVHLVDDHVDVALRIGHLEDSTMVATRVGSMRFVVCASPDLLDRHGVPLQPHDLQKLPLVTTDGPLPGRKLAVPGGGIDGSRPALDRPQAFSDGQRNGRAGRAGRRRGGPTAALPGGRSGGRGGAAACP